MTPIDYHPDWLLPTPPRSPYLVKDEYTMASGTIDSIIYKFYMISQGEEYIDFHRFVNRDEGHDLLEARQQTKLLQKELEEQKLLKDNEEIKKIK